MKLQEVIIQIAEKHGLDLTLAGSCLQLTLGGEDWLEIEIYADHEIAVTHYQPSTENTLLVTPGVVFWVAEAEWTLLEIVQDKTRSAPTPGEASTTPPYTLLMNKRDSDAFLDRWAQILAQTWLPHAQPASVHRKE